MLIMKKCGILYSNIQLVVLLFELYTKFGKNAIVNFGTK
jgi:hypothetical protein